jgi:hypothetical protein
MAETIAAALRLVAMAASRQARTGVSGTLMAPRR